jgi:hypothetical protein
MNTIYRPSVCHQTADEHVHYDVILDKPPSLDSTSQLLLRNLSAKVGGRTAGQIISLLLEKRELGIDLSRYGINYIKKEIIPTSQVCHKGELESPSIDWNENLYSDAVVPPTTPPAHVLVGRVNHSVKTSDI